MLPVQLHQVAASQSLLEVCLDNGIRLHHNCGAVCACSTCHLYIDSGMEFLTELTSREVDFLDRAMNPHSKSRLACQSVLLPGNGSLEITLPDQSQFPGEED